MEDFRLSHVQILVEQGRYAEAETILKDLLYVEADNIFLLSLLAEVKLQQDKPEEAQTIVNNAIGLAPDAAHLFYLKSRISIDLDNYDEAEKAIVQAIALNPHNDDYFAWHAHIKLVRKQYEAALKLANRALEIDAENLLGLNVRSTALLKLDRKEDSFNTIEGALREDPNNAYTHANYGWGLLEKGDHKKALVHFKEALKNNPNLSYAQAGMIEALKANNIVYRLFLKYAFFMSNLTAKYQWGVIIGYYLGFRILSGIAKSNKALEPYLTPVLVVLAVFAFSTWVINPISNLFLRLNAYGQFLLNKKQKMSSNFVGISLLICLAGTALYFIMSDERFLTIAAFGFAMMVPFSKMFSEAKYKNLFPLYAIAMAVVGVLAIGITFVTGEIFNFMSTIFLFGFIAFQWIANYLLIEEDNR